MTWAHRHGDYRKCGATTTVIGQNNVFVNGKLWAVEGDTETHTGGALVCFGSGPGNGTSVKINGKKVITAPGSDYGSSDGSGHNRPLTDPLTSSSNVIAYGLFFFDEPIPP